MSAELARQGAECGGRGAGMGQRLRETAETRMGGDKDWLTRVK